MTIGTNQLNQPIRSVNNQRLPSDGPKAAPLTLAFANYTSVLIDLSTLLNRGFINLIQTMYVDNSLNSESVTFQFGSPVTQQIIVPPLSQGFYSLLLPDPPVVNVASTGAVNVSVILLNVPVSPSVWYPAGPGTFKFDGNGNLETSDQNLATAISNGYVLAQDFGRGNNDTVYPQFIDGNWVNEVLSGASVSAFNLFGGTSFWLDGADISLSGDAFLAAAGELTTTLYNGPNAANVTGATVIMSKTIYLPGAVPATPAPIIQLLSYQQLQYHNKTNANGYCHLVISAALSGGKLTANLFGGITALQT